MRAPAGAVVLLLLFDPLLPAAADSAAIVAGGPLFPGLRGGKAVVVWLDRARLQLAGMALKGDLTGRTRQTD